MEKLQLQYHIGIWTIYILIFIRFHLPIGPWVLQLSSQVWKPLKKHCWISGGGLQKSRDFTVRSLKILLGGYLAFQWLPGAQGTAVVGVTGAPVKVVLDNWRGYFRWTRDLPAGFSIIILKNFTSCLPPSKEAVTHPYSDLA